MVGGLVEVRPVVRKGQKWFTKELRKLRKNFHRAEAAWLRATDLDDKKIKRSMYIEVREVNI